MPDTERKRLDWRPVRNPFPARGRVAVLIGALPLAVGAAFVLMGLGAIPIDMYEIREAWPGMIGLGATFAAVGTMFLARGLADLRRQSRLRTEKELNPGQPWLCDHEWDPSGTWNENRRWGAAPVFFGVVIAALVTPVAVLVVRRGPELFTVLPVGIFYLGSVLLFGLGLYRLAQALKCGRSRLDFERFPFLLGEKLDVRFRNDRGIGRFRRLEFTLRCVETAYQMQLDPGGGGDPDGAGGGWSAGSAMYQVYSDTVTLDARRLPRHKAGQDLKIAFALPSGDYETKLSERPPRYWTLEVKADTPGIDFVASFLVPVYASPSRDAVEGSGREGLVRRDGR